MKLWVGVSGEAGFGVTLEEGELGGNQAIVFEDGIPATIRKAQNAHDRDKKIEQL